MAYETLIYEVGDDRVATITINRPERMNTWTNLMCAEFARLWGEIKLDARVHAVVLRAAGERAFSTGVDVKDEFVQPSNVWNHSDGGEDLGPKQNKCWKPVVCAVHGLAAGGALYWINESDIVICSEDAQFFDPHTTFGLIPSNEPIGLARMVHPREALRMALMGNDERISAETALRIGLVTEVVPRERLWARAHEIAALIAKKPSVATQGAVRAVWESLDFGRQAALDHGIIYNRIGNPIGEAQVDRWNLPKAKWSLR
jgi:enoyl-CoA hydratase/carnithine racemase